MSVFHKLQDIYFDAMNLFKELDSIPPQCDCSDADAHLSGKCCCAVPNSQSRSEGCLSLIERLKSNIEWFSEDLYREGKDIRPGELPDGAEGRLSLVINLVDNLNLSLKHLETDINEFRSSCAHSALDRMRKKSDELARYLEELNRLL